MASAGASVIVLQTHRLFTKHWWPPSLTQLLEPHQGRGGGHHSVARHTAAFTQPECMFLDWEDMKRLWKYMLFNLQRSKWN